MAVKQVGKAASGSTDGMSKADVLGLAATAAQAAALSSGAVLMTPATVGAAVAAYLASLPTSLPASSGQLWWNGGTLSMS